MYFKPKCLYVQNDGDLEMADDFEDLTQSSDTATEELESATSGYFNVSLLIKQLDTSSIGKLGLYIFIHFVRHYIEDCRLEQLIFSDSLLQGD